MIALPVTPIKSPRLNFIMAGQSNMVGFGELSELPFFPEAFKIHATEPTHGQGASCGLSFASDMGCEVGLIPCAVGGTKMSEWQKGGTLYTAMIAKCTVPVHGMIFYQGEADAALLNDANQWASRFGDFVDDVTADLNIPIVYAQLCKPAGSRPYFSTVKAQQASYGGNMIITDDLDTI